MKNIKVIIEYDGTNYSGWQRQKNSIAIENVVEDSIRKALNEDIDILGASRTDSGVHARGQVANFMTATNIPIERLALVINSKLPRDIRVTYAEEASNDFHCRYCSIGKMYSYTIFNRKIAPAIMRDYVSYCSYDLNVDKMKFAAQYFLGTHDFSAFKSTGSSTKTSIRTIKRLDLIVQDDFIKIYIEADGFLYNMVRIIAGTLIKVGNNKISEESITDIINSRDRKRAGKTAPACGLCLEKVYY